MKQQDLSGLTCPNIGCGDQLRRTFNSWECPVCGDRFKNYEDYNRKAKDENEWLHSCLGFHVGYDGALTQQMMQ